MYCSSSDHEALKDLYFGDLFTERYGPLVLGPAQQMPVALPVIWQHEHAAIAIR